MSFSFDEAVCLVTGGAQGIGWAISQALAARGARVHILDIDPHYLQTASQSVPALRQRMTFSQGDVSRREDVEAWVAGVRKQEGRIDALVNNAAYVRWGTFEQVPPEDTLRMMEVGFRGTVYTTHAVLPGMLARGHGRIVNIGSSAGKVFVGGSSAGYAAVKAAIDGYTQTLQSELHASPVRLTLVRPGAVAGTDFFRKHVPSSLMPRMADFIPYLTPPQVAYGILHAMQRGKPILDLPGYLPFFYLFFELFPGFLRALIRLGGAGRRDYGNVAWHMPLE